MSTERKQYCLIILIDKYLMVYQDFFFFFTTHFLFTNDDMITYQVFFLFIS